MSFGLKIALVIFGAFWSGYFCGRAAERWNAIRRELNEIKRYAEIKRAAGAPDAGAVGQPDTSSGADTASR